jgi:hypothetical protein
MKRHCGKITPLAVCGILLFLVCGKDTNPYMDPSLADVTLTGLPSDTVSLFSTFEFQADFKLGFHFSRIEVHVDNNRLWYNNDTVCSNNQNQFGRAVLSFSASISDTGRKMVFVKGFRSNGDSIQHDFSLYCGSPLHQADIVGSVGQLVQLSTSPVKDHVVYVWKFFDDSAWSDLPTSSIVLGKSFASAPGRLYIKYGEVVSPAFPFIVSLVDKIPPDVWCVNVNDSLVNNTVYTLSKNFLFKVKARDNSGTIAAISINTQAFDTTVKFGDTLLCTKAFSLDSLSKDILAVVTAIDVSNNSVTDTFRITYVEPPKPAVRFTRPAIDSEIITDSSFTLTGVVDNVRGVDSLFLSMTINSGQIAGSIFTVGPQWSWQWPVLLRAQYNTVRVVAISRSADTVARGRTVIVYQQSGQPPDTAKVNFVSRDTTVFEGASGIKIFVSCSKKASRQILATLQTAGTAGATEYSLIPQQLKFNIGDSIVFATLTTVDNKTCDGSRTLRISLANVQGAGLGPDSAIVDTIRDNDTLLCKKNIAFVSPVGSLLNAFEKSLFDTLTVHGYNVVRLSKPQDIQAYNCFIISPMVKTDSAGALLAKASVPVLCASQACIVSLGLAKAADTGTVNSSSVQITSSQDNFLPAAYQGTTVRIATSIGKIPWARQGTGGHVIANCASQITVGPGTPGVVLYPVFTSYKKGDMLASGTASPEKRLLFPTMENSGRTSQYLQDWWNLLRLSVEWIMSSK